jgi:hypothetical protein
MVGVVVLMQLEWLFLCSRRMQLAQNVCGRNKKLWQRSGHCLMVVTACGAMSSLCLIETSNELSLLEILGSTLLEMLSLLEPLHLSLSSCDVANTITLTVIMITFDLPLGLS